ncbi:MAG: hypothetical protein IIZ12_01540 [Eggerthellaceae bacterium]|nr:hypothetical protein [Eggerthellaceae bacterium]
MPQPRERTTERRPRARDAERASERRSRTRVADAREGQVPERRRRVAGAEEGTVPERRRRAGNAGNHDARSKIAAWRRWGVRAVMAVMALGCVIGLAFFIRPTTSDFEKRELTAFPTPSVASFLDGTFFSDLSLWYADTYPLREPLVKADHALENLYGIQPETQFVGGNVQADELPVEGDTVAPATVEREEVAPPEAQAVQEDVQANIMNGLYVEGGTACSVYYFYEPAVTTYCAAVNKCAEELDGVADVYSVLIPNNSGATLDESVLDSLGGSNQKQALDYFHSLMDPRVKVVETYDALRAHRDEYIFFRTDHHWTQLGAYYAYVEFCKVKGIEPFKLSDREEVAYDSFLGSFYAELQLPAMADNPDTMYAYIPNGTNDLTYWTADGEEFEGNVIADASVYDDNAKYMAFIMGDQERQIIENPKVTDGSSCLVIKDSYGCAFVPNLVDNYQTIHVLDFRKTWRNIPEYVRENNIQDVIFMNNMTIAGTDTAADALYSIM